MSLFSSLPEQKPPQVVEADQHELVRCADCKGEGRERYSYISGGYGSERGSRLCAGCNGTGKLLRFIGPKV